MVKAARSGIVQIESMNPSPLYWRIGKLIQGMLDENASADTARLLYAQVADALSPEYGREFDAEALKHYGMFVERFPEYEKVVTLCKDLTWDHFNQLIAIDDNIERDFYAWMTVIKKWNADALRERIRDSAFDKATTTGGATVAQGRRADTEDYESALMKALLSRDPTLMTFLTSDED